MRTVGLLVLCALLIGCGTAAPTATPAPPPRSATLTAQQVLTGLPASGTVRLDTLGHTVARGTGNAEEIVVLLYIGPTGASATATGYLIVGPPGGDMAALRTARSAALTQSAAQPLLLAQDRNALLYLGFAKSDDPEADRTTVEAALRAIP